MVLPKSKQSVGLGNSLMKDRFGKGKGSDMRRGNAIQRKGPGGETYVTNEKKEASWVKMRSITEQAALDEFLATAELAGTDFTAEKMNNVKIIHTDQKNPFLLTSAEEKETLKKHSAHRDRLQVPRRPPWDESTTPQELDALERQSMLEWRRGLAELQETKDLLLTPFERNIEVWRQLWRVIERSDLVVQIVDARNPLLFRCEDLERYVHEVDPKKTNLLLVNKADMLSLEQRRAWARYFKQAGINFRFFSAELAKRMNESNDYQEEDSNKDHWKQDDLDRSVSSESQTDSIADPDNSNYIISSDDEDESIRILTTAELESLFLANAPNPSSPSSLTANTSSASGPRKTIVGLVGYPNVGKSSTINALLGSKKVSVSATPGKTKHFQTLHLSPAVLLCDCPGLVFPNFASTKADLVVNGVLPIDQLREHTGPAGLVARRIPKKKLESVYGMKIRLRPREEGGTGVPTASELLKALAKARGFATQGMGVPDESRAARIVLKDYVKGKLVWVHPPPAGEGLEGLNEGDFNRQMYADEDEDASQEEDKELAGDIEGMSIKSTSKGLPQDSQKGTRLDKSFFGRGKGNAGHVTKRAFHQQQPPQLGAGHQRGKQLSGRKQKAIMAMELGVDPSELRLNSKKHFKGNRRKGKEKNEGEDDDD